MKKKLLIALIALVLAVVLIVAATVLLLPQYHYSRALSLMEEKNYNEAYVHLKKCEDFKDSKELLENFVTIYDSYTITNGAGEIQSKKEYTYDENDNLILEQSFGKGGAAGSKIEYAYDENGNEILSISRNDGNLMNHSEYEYDEYGNMTRWTGYDEKGNATYEERTEYEYDKYGNMTLKIEYDNDGNVKAKTEYTNPRFTYRPQEDE